jgi:drug/metabolite transporter (DMT)-like permease/GNAT superfamily N-acetyltransferase
MPPESRKWLTSYLLFAAISGNSFFFVKVAVQSLEPLQISFARVTIGVATLVVFLIATGRRLPTDRKLWGYFAVAAIFQSTLPFTLYGYGVQHVSSVLAAIWNATTPLCTLLCALVLRTETATHAKVSGLVLGFVGAMIVLGIWRPISGGDLLGSLACFGAAVCYGIANAYVVRFIIDRSEPLVVLATGQLIAGGVQLALIMTFLGIPLVDVSAPVATWACLLALGTLGTGVAYVFLNHVLRSAGATVASTMTYLIPIFALASGVVFLGERLTWNQPVGALVVFLGVAVTQGLIRIRSPAGAYPDQDLDVRPTIRNSKQGAIMTAQAVPQNLGQSRVVSVNWNDPDAVVLRAALSEELSARYADREADPNHLPREMTVRPETVVYVGIAYCKGTPTGHIALRRLGSEFELKNMYVVPNARGSGVSTALLAAVEDAARQSGARRIILQTGDRQPEAVGLYQRQGYSRIAIFPPYERLAYSYCFERVVR